VLIGCRSDKGNTFGVNLITASDTLQDKQTIERAPLRNVCLLKGGIDAVKVEHPELLTKNPSQQTELYTNDIFARYVHKHQHQGSSNQKEAS